ncbi:MAG TPA: glyoxalase [Micromonosporaceae bacterium]|nr:glyoxalase [Micromonosporaceae bacterium]HCU49651.1 glyoxalase [Micromonosporaceae bacterium]
MTSPVTGTLHHVELWVPDLKRAIVSWGWLLEQLGYSLFQEFNAGRSWRLGHTYIVVEQSPAISAPEHDRLRPGLNHLSFHVESTGLIDSLVRQAPEHGWALMFADRHPYAGGENYYAAYLEDVDGFEVELVASGDVP